LSDQGAKPQHVGVASNEAGREEARREDTVCCAIFLVVGGCFGWRYKLISPDHHRETADDDDEEEGRWR
jgi:hypothetical protein